MKHWFGCLRLAVFYIVYSSLDGVVHWASSLQGFFGGTYHWGAGVYFRHFLRCFDLRLMTGWYSCVLHRWVSLGLILFPTADSFKLAPPVFSLIRNLELSSEILWRFHLSSCPFVYCFPLQIFAALVRSGGLLDHSLYDDRAALSQFFTLFSLSLLALRKLLGRASFHFLLQL